MKAEVTMSILELDTLRNQIADQRRQIVLLEGKQKEIKLTISQRSHGMSEEYGWNHLGPYKKYIPGDQWVTHERFVNLEDVMSELIEAAKRQTEELLNAAIIRRDEAEKEIRNLSEKHDKIIRKKNDEIAVLKGEEVKLQAEEKIKHLEGLLKKEHEDVIKSFEKEEVFRKRITAHNYLPWYKRLFKKV